VCLFGRAQCLFRAAAIAGVDRVWPDLLSLFGVERRNGGFRVPGDHLRNARAEASVLRAPSPCFTRSRLNPKASAGEQRDSLPIAATSAEDDYAVTASRRRVNSPRESSSLTLVCRYTSYRTQIEYAVSDFEAPTRVGQIDGVRPS
jgi:hypothetical protein